MKSWLANFWQKVQASFWFVPALMAVLVSVLSIVTVALDRHAADWLTDTGLFWAGEPQGAREMLTTIAGSMITVAGVTFSITIVALTLAASQFGPRLLRSFMRDLGNQVVLGTFLSTFLFCLLVLRVVNSGEADGAFIPHLSITTALALAVAGIGVLIYFIHHVAMSLQAENLAAAIATEFREIVSFVFPDEDGAEEPAPEENLPDKFEEESRGIPALRSGYVQTIERESLIALAEQHDLLLKVGCAPGEFVVRGQPLVRAWPQAPLSDRLAEEIAGSFVVGRHRTPTQDASYALHHLVSVAVRALSPGINDPFTANTCIDWLADGLSEVARRRPPPTAHRGESGRVRLLTPTTTFAQLADVAFDQIREPGADFVAVVRRLLDTIAAVGRHATRAEDRRALQQHADRILQAAQNAGHQRRDVEDLEALHRRVSEILAGNPQHV